MTTLYIEVKRLKKRGLFSWEKPKYETLFMSYKDFDDDNEAAKTLKSIDDWFVGPFDGVGRIWVDTWTNKWGKVLESKTCFVKDMAYTAFAI